MRRIYAVQPSAPLSARRCLKVSKFCNEAYKIQTVSPRLTTDHSITLITRQFTVNYTRFYILSHGLDTRLPVVDKRPQLRRALVRLSLPPIETSHEPSTSDANIELEPSAPPKPSHSRTVHLVMSTLLTTFGVPVIRLDRRPSINPSPFEDTYFLELEDFGTPVEPSADGSAADGAWLTRVRMGVERVIAVGGQADVIGVW